MDEREPIRRGSADEGPGASQQRGSGALQQQTADVRYRRGATATWVSLIGNAAIALGKLILALMTGSIALMADAFHTASDIVTSVVVMIGLRVGRQPADRRHPYGHGRAETIAALIVGVLLAVAGIEFLMRSLRRLSDAGEAVFGLHMGDYGLWISAGIVMGTAICKEWMARYSLRVGREISSAALMADAWHHRTDALSSVLVAASLVGAQYGYFRLDAAVGLGVSVFILYTAWTFIQKAWSKLLGEAPQDDLIGRIEQIAREMPGVKDAHGVTVHDYGTRQMASVHVTLHAGQTVEHAHRVATAVESALAAKLGLSALVHVEPDACQNVAPVPVDLREQVRDLLLRHPQIISFHALQLHLEDHGTELDLNLHIQPETTIEAAHHLEHEVTAILVDRFPDLHVHLHVEPCDLNCDPCPGTCRPD